MSVNITNDELVFFGVCGFLQKWGEKRSFSYLDLPRPDHGLIYILADEGVFECADGTKKVFKKGAVVYLPKGKKYRASFFGNEDVIYTLLINFMTDGDKLLLSEITELSKDGKGEEYFRSIIDLCKTRKNALFPVMREFYALLDTLFPSAPEALPCDIGILPAVNYIDTHLEENPSVPELAKLCLLSESGFRKRFTSALGQTPHEYILSAKLARACRMLGNPEVPIADVAYELGFCDAAHFTKIFTAKIGKSPSEYRIDYRK